MRKESARAIQAREKATKKLWLTELREKGVRFRTFHIIDSFILTHEQFSLIPEGDDHEFEFLKGRIVVASHYSPQTASLHLQFSFCSAYNVFDRKEGQYIAAERLMNSPIDKKMEGNTIELIKEILLEEGRKRNISWMLDMTKENVK